MDLSELAAYARKKHQLREQYEQTEIPGFSVLCHPETGKWIALLMRQWDSETGEEIQRCDIKCGQLSSSERSVPYLSPAFRMCGSKWTGIRMERVTEPETVFRLLDRAVRNEGPHGFTIVLESLLEKIQERVSVLLSSADDVRTARSYADTALPFFDSAPREPREKAPLQLLKMQRMYQYGPDPVVSRARNFYRQAVFMQDYEDSLPWSGEFSHYFPTYHDLNIRQLRGYFTWRAEARRGHWQPIATSAAYIYLFELLNGIGAGSPEDALDKLKAFEAGYLGAGYGDERMRKDLRRWMLEYSVLKGLPPETARGFADPEILDRDAALAVLKAPNAHSDNEVFAALCTISGKKAVGPPVIASDPVRGKHLFSEVWRKASGFQWEGKRLFTLCFGRKKSRRWYPLSGAVYYEREKQDDRDHELDACRTFSLRNGAWHESSYEVLSFDKVLFRGFIHETDTKLRRYLKTGRYLKEDPADQWVIPYIDEVIEAEKQALKAESRARVSIDLSGLERIRRDADRTRDILLTEEEPEKAEEAGDLIPPAAADETNGIPLDPVLARILRALLKGQDVSEIIREHHLMPSLVADAINEAFLEEIGDTVLLAEGDVLTLVEDYTKDIEGLLGGDSDG